MEIKGRVILYSVVGCPHCAAAKAKLGELRLPFTEVSVDRFPSYVREWLRRRTGKSGLPQIFFNSTLIGGNVDLLDLIQDKKRFDAILKDVIENDPPVEGDESPLLPNPGEAIEANNEEEFVGEFAALAKEIRERSGILMTHYRKIFSSGIKDSFTGKDFVDWVLRTKGVDREAGIQIGKEFLARKFAVSINDGNEFKDDSSSFYRLTSAADNVNALNVNNAFSKYLDRSAGEIAEDIRKITLSLYSDHLSEDGKFVDYEAIKASANFKSFKGMTLELQRVDIETMTDDEKLAFFINIYNTLVIHGAIERGTPTGIWQRYKFFSSIGYVLGGYFYSLNDIENGVLRANRGSMATLYRKSFRKDDDPRLKIALPEVEPRIHFALNCGAKSCPPIRTFSANEVQNQLNIATEAYLEDDDESVRIEKETVHLSAIFRWYEADFGKNKEEVLKWIFGKLPAESEKRKRLGEIIQNGNPKIKYIPYDWTNNAKRN